VIGWLQLPGDFDGFRAVPPTRIFPRRYRYNVQRLAAFREFPRLQDNIYSLQWLSGLFSGSFGVFGFPGWCFGTLHRYLKVSGAPGDIYAIFTGYQLFGDFYGCRAIFTAFSGSRVSLADLSVSRVVFRYLRRYFRVFGAPGDICMPFTG
jgi:hypothetical protein